jgi:hypothetical protein
MDTRHRHRGPEEPRCCNGPVSSAPRRTRRELAATQRQIALLQHAAWMDVSRGGQGTQNQGDDKVRAMLMLDGWRPDMQFADQAGYFDIHRLHEGGIPGVTD